MSTTTDHEGLLPIVVADWKPGQTILAIVEDGNQAIRIEFKLSRFLSTNNAAEAFYKNRFGEEELCRFDLSSGWKFYLIQDSQDPDDLLVRKIYEAMISDPTNGEMASAEYVLGELRKVADIIPKEMP